MNGLSAAANCLGQYFAQFAALLDPTEVAQVELLSYKLEHRVIEIAVFGLVSTGKTTLLNALLGKKIGATSPLNGTTQGLATQTWSIKAGQGKAQIRFIDTPGLDEIDGAQRSELTFAVADRVDVILFVATGDLNPLELAALQGLQQRQKPILLIVNKADLYLDADKIALQAALVAKLSNTNQAQSQSAQTEIISKIPEIVFTAAAPLPRLVRHEYSDGSAPQESWENPPPDVAAVQAKILDLLNREGKDLVALNVMRELAQIQRHVKQRHFKPLSQWVMGTLGAVVGLSIFVVLSPWQWLDGLGCEVGGVLLCLVLVGRYLWRYLLWGQWLWGVAIAGLGLGVMVLAWLSPTYSEAQTLTAWFTPQDGREILGLILGLPLMALGSWWQIQRLVGHPDYGAETVIAQILAPWQDQPQSILGQLAMTHSQQGQTIPGRESNAG